MISFNIDKVKNVLILMPDKHMGNLVVSLAAVEALKNHFSGRKIYLVTDASYKDIAETLPGIDRFVFYPRKDLRESHLLKRIKIFMIFFAQLFRIFPDITVDLDGRQVSSLLTFFSGARLRIGSSTALLAFCYNRKVTITAGRHRVYSYIEIAESAGALCDTVSCRIKASEAEKTFLRDILLKEGISLNRPLVCIHPGAGKIYKQWTAEGFADVADWLSGQALQVVFIGDKRETEKIDMITSGMKNRYYNLAGKLTIGRLMALLEDSSLFIGNDSGPMHLAAALNVPVITLFGPADEKRWGPLSERCVILRGQEPCDECRGKDCAIDFRCIRTITPEQVKNAVKTLMNIGQK